MISDQEKDALDNIYFRGEGGSFSSVVPLYRAAKKSGLKTITYEKVKEFLRSVPAYQKHRRILRKFPRKSFLVAYCNEIWSLDLIFFNNNKSVQNKQRRYALTTVDCFSRKGYARALVKKTAYETMQAFKDIMKEAGAIPKKIFVDKGGEFWGKEFNQYCKSLNIELYTTSTTIKAFSIESFNFALKLILYRQLSFYNNSNWVSVLQNSIEIYNNNPSRSIANLTPNEACTPKNHSKLQKFLFSKRAEKAKTHIYKKPLYREGQSVRKLINPHKFTRGFKPRWSSDHSIISKVYTNSLPITYRLEGEKRLYYNQELQSSNPRADLEDKFHKILSIVHVKKRATEFLRSGKPTKYENDYLVKIDGIEKPKYLSSQEIEKEYKNGSEMLEEFHAKHKNG